MENSCAVEVKVYEELPSFVKEGARGWLHAAVVETCVGGMCEDANASPILTTASSACRICPRRANDPSPDPRRLMQPPSRVTLSPRERAAQCERSVRGILATEGRSSLELGWRLFRRAALEDFDVAVNK